jgi:short chain dehydrogenase
MAMPVSEGLPSRGSDLGAVAAGDLAAHRRGDDRFTSVADAVVRVPKQLNSKGETPMTARVAIVTGASSGIGLGITRALLERGYRVVANSRTISDSKDRRPSASLVLFEIAP